MLKKVFFISIIALFIEACTSSKKAIEVLSFEKTEIENSNDTVYLEQCKKWILDQSSLVEIISSSDTITAHEKNYIFNTLPCEYKGKIRVKGKTYKFILNAGSYTVIYDKNSIYYLGYFKQDKKFFIDKPDTKQDSE